jgi:ParB family chromosome partitioning protein
MHELPIGRIRPNPQQPRQAIRQEELEELAQSIREHGLLQPLVVSRSSDGSYLLIAGERRWRAAQAAGLETIPAVVKEATPQARLEMALVENIQRQDLNALEAAHAFRQLVDEHGLTQEALAQRLGKSRVAVSNTLRLLQLPDPVQQALLDGDVSEGHARAILAAPTPDAQVALMRRVVAEGLSVRATEALARTAALAAHAPRPEPRPADPEVERMEDAFRQALGTRVRLVRGRKGGRLVIHFFSDDELQGLYEAIVRE